MKHSHRPPRHRSGSFAKGPKEGGESRFQRPERHTKRKFHKSERGGSFPKGSPEEGESRFQKPEYRAERKFQKPDHKTGRRPHKPDYANRKLQRPDRSAPPHREETRPPLAAKEGILLWGLHAVREAWLNPKRRCVRLWATEGALAHFEKTREEAKGALINRPDPKKVERFELDRLTPPGSVHQGLVIEAIPLPEPSLHDIIGVETPPDLVIALDQVTDPHNVGAIARSAASLGAAAIIMTERNAPGLTGVLAKAASGAIEHVPLIHIVNLARAIEELQQTGYWCIGLAEEGARELSECDLSGRTALILGAEGEGLRQLTRKKCDELARLPTQGPVGSLNVSNAAAVALYEARRQKGKFA